MAPAKETWLPFVCGTVYVALLFMFTCLSMLSVSLLSLFLVFFSWKCLCLSRGRKCRILLQEVNSLRCMLGDSEVTAQGTDSHTCCKLLRAPIIIFFQTQCLSMMARRGEWPMGRDIAWRRYLLTSATGAATVSQPQCRDAPAVGGGTLMQCLLTLKEKEVHRKIFQDEHEWK